MKDGVKPAFWVLVEQIAYRNYQEALLGSWVGLLLSHSALDKPYIYWLVFNHLLLNYISQQNLSPRARVMSQ